MEVSPRPDSPEEIAATKVKRSHRSSLNPMTDSFLDKMEDLNRSAAGMEMLAPGAYAGVPSSHHGDSNDGNGRTQSGRKTVRGSRSGQGHHSVLMPFALPAGVPRWLGWVIYIIMMVLSAIGAAVVIQWVVAAVSNRGG